MIKIKVIDLLNKIANGEEVPKKIKVLDGIYYYCGKDESGNCYYSEPEGCGGIRLSFNTSQLNDEIEIIEDKKIEKLETYKEIDDEVHYANILKVSKNGEYEIDEALSVAIDKINEIIDHINNGDDK